VAVLLASAPAGAKLDPGVRCYGRFLVGEGQAPLIRSASPPAPDAVVVTTAGAMIRSGCPMVPAVMQPWHDRWLLRARWKACGETRVVRLRATIAADCSRLDGRLRIGKRKRATVFSGLPSRCGDGFLDPDGGERCEPPGTATCDDRCRRIDPLPPRCGDGRVDPGEECDDGNGEDADACPNTCRTTCADHEFDSTWQAIQERVLTARCAVASCHGSLPQADLSLLPGAAHPALVDVAANNPAAAARGKKRVVPGNPAASFLVQKLRGLLAADEGFAMPRVGQPLTANELAAIEAWIRAGAERTGIAPGAPCLPRPVFQPAPALVPPVGGHQLVLEGPTLRAGEEQEGCFWVPVPNRADFTVGKFEFSLNPGTHHFAIFQYGGPGVPQTGVWQRDNSGCFNGAGLVGSLSGAPFAPYFVDAYPPGVARLLRAGSYIGLNAHYHNAFDVPVQVKVWINLYPYAGPPPHIAETLQALDSTFLINVPPFTQQVHRGHYVNATGRPLAFLGISGHMHYRGLRFTAWQSDGTKVYENFDWGHPGGRGWDPPFRLQPGDYFDYECLYDNGVDRPVRRDPSGNPTALIFGVTTEDAMCILTGAYYPD
jgi:cysteine-rich repeat protein